MTDVVAAGDVVPDFSLKDHLDREVRLSALRGKKVLLSFHPLAWTSVCAEQMKSLEANAGRFTERNALALGVSVDTVPSKKAWAQKLGVERTPLLSDFWPHGEVARSLGIFREKQGTSERANIIVGEDGRAAFVKIYPIPQLPDIEEIIGIL